MDTGTTSHQQQQQQQHISSLEISDGGTGGRFHRLLDESAGDETATEVVAGMNVAVDATSGAVNIHRATKEEDSEVPEDITAFYGHPLTAASHSANGDGLALLHEYQSLPFIDRSAAAAAAAVMNDAVFVAGNDISQRYAAGLHANALEYEESLELDHHPHHHHHHQQQHHHHHHHHQLPPISVQSSSSSGAEFGSSGELIRQNALFTEDVDELSEPSKDADLIHRYDNETFLHPRKNPLYDLNGSPATNLSQSHHFGSVPESSSPAAFPEATGDLIAEGKALFSSFEDEDAALTYYGHGVDDDDDDDDDRDFPVTTSTLVTYDLVMSHHHNHQVSRCLDKIPGAGDLAVTSAAGMFCVPSPSCSPSEENLINGGLVEAVGRDAQMTSEARFYAASGGGGGGLFPRGRMKSGGGKFTANSEEATIVVGGGGGGTKQIGGSRRRPSAQAGTGNNTRKRKALNALPGNSLPRPGLEFYHDDRTFSLSKYELNPVLNSPLHLAQDNFAYPPAVSENALQRSAYASHGPTEGYQSAFTYLDSEYQTLLASSSGEQRVAGLNGGQKDHHPLSVSSGNLEYQRRDLASEAWQSTFLGDEEFHLNPSSSRKYRECVVVVVVVSGGRWGVRR